MIRKKEFKSLYCSSIFFIIFQISFHAQANDIILVHDKGLPIEYMKTRRNLREYNRNRNSFMYAIDLKRGQILRKYNSVYGINEGDKRHEGDRRTPVGKYEIISINKKDCASRFGPFSMLIDYPNYYDRKRHNPGFAITIHGGPKRRTEGCIRILDNRHYYISYSCYRAKGFSDHNVKSIWEIKNKNYGRYGTSLLSFSSLHRNYKGKEGDYLTTDSIKFYQYLLGSSHLSNIDIDNLGSRYIKRPKKIVSQKKSLTTHASSCLNSFYDINYKSENVLDGDSKTAWVEGAQGYGKGEFIRIIFPEKERISRIELVNGYDKRTESGDRWKQNNRVKRLRVDFSNREYFFWNLIDTRKAQYIKFDPTETRFVTFTIEDVYRGQENSWNDTCISEIRIR